MQLPRNEENRATNVIAEHKVTATQQDRVCHSAVRLSCSETKHLCETAGLPSDVNEGKLAWCKEGVSNTCYLRLVSKVYLP